jgi:hypothetical protein
VGDLNDEDRARGSVEWIHRLPIEKKRPPRHFYRPFNNGRAYNTNGKEKSLLDSESLPLLLLLSHTILFPASYC